jgi:hypothetical protein
MSWPGIGHGLDLRMCGCAWLSGIEWHALYTSSEQGVLLAKTSSGGAVKVPACLPLNDSVSRLLTSILAPVVLL